MDEATSLKRLKGKIIGTSVWGHRVSPQLPDETPLPAARPPPPGPPLQDSPLSKAVPFDGQKASPEQTCRDWLWIAQSISWGKHHFLSAFPESVKSVFVLAFFRLRVIFRIPQFERITLHLVIRMRAGGKLIPQRQSPIIMGSNRGRKVNLDQLSFKDLIQHAAYD